MYNKKYVLEKIEEFGEHNSIYDDIEGNICYPAYFNVGERGWFLGIEDRGWGEYAHRIHTSTVNDVEYNDNQVIVTTRNTRLTFTLIDE